MTKRIPESKRWVKVRMLGKPTIHADGAKDARYEHEKALAVLAAFEAVGRVVRAEVCGDAIMFLARRG